jgi:hypothetical protein
MGRERNHITRKQALVQYAIYGFYLLEVSVVDITGLRWVNSNVITLSKVFNQCFPNYLPQFETCLADILEDTFIAIFSGLVL